MNKEYWQNFYKKKNAAPTERTDFAVFCSRFIKDGQSIIDVGCGNGRDTMYFYHAFENSPVCGVDQAIKEKIGVGPAIYKVSLSELLTWPCNYDVVYCRFFLHAITPEEVDALLDWVTGTLMVEFRTDEDVPVLFPDHDRNLIDPVVFISKLIEKKYTLSAVYSGRGMAVYKNEDPHVCRVVARRKKCSKKVSTSSTKK